MHPLFMPPEIEKLASNKENIRRLNEQLLTPAGIVPFIGAGIGIPYGMPGWTAFLQALAEEAGIQAKIAALLRRGEYEEAAEQLETALGLFVFFAAIEREFGDHKLDEQIFWGNAVHILQLTEGPILTTNFDRVLETAALRLGRPFETIVVGAKPDAISQMLRQQRRGLIKLHGDWIDRTERILNRVRVCSALWAGPNRFSQATASSAAICSNW